MKDARTFVMQQMPWCTSTNDKQKEMQEKKCFKDAPKRTYTHQTSTKLKQDKKEKTSESRGDVHRSMRNWKVLKYKHGNGTKKITKAQRIVETNYRRNKHKERANGKMCME